MNEFASGYPQWAARLHELCPQIAGPRGPALRPEAWQIVYANLSRYLRYHAARMGKITADDVADISSQKTLELMAKEDVSSGRLSELNPDQIPGFLSTVARNGLITFLKKARREAIELEDDDASAEPARVQRADAQHNVESTEYAVALRECAESVEPKSRRVWFYRVFYEMPSKDIAAHPRVSMSPSHIDVVLHRVRTTVRDCMDAKGHDTSAMPPGTFVALWKLFHPVEGTGQEVM